MNLQELCDAMRRSRPEEPVALLQWQRDVYSIADSLGDDGGLWAYEVITQGHLE